ncbi:MAG: hypothetical protein DRN30_02830 [Thermoplasmata archaeon]|nr:TIM barrel protein [Euryarchaeota archaeon]RLF66060.1 MAG: hypothetical protein DRN30_02830 [Thermoplasmata archaeon]
MARFGPAGIPTVTKPRDVVKGIEDVYSMGLDLMELEFVYGVWIKNSENGLKKALEIKNKAKELDVFLSAHAPYYINLASEDKKKIQASIQRLVDSARAAHWTGARYVVFHPGYYGKLGKDEAYKIVKENLARAIEMVKDRGYEVYLSPETTGKVSQIGSLEEVVRLCEELDGLWPTVDFAHLHARNRGKYSGENAKEIYMKDLEFIEDRLGYDVVKRLHIHFSGIEYGEKGEKKHLILRHSDLSFEALAEALVEMGLTEVTIVSESPILEQDALLMKEIYKRMLHQVKPSNKR